MMVLTQSEHGLFLFHSLGFFLYYLVFLLVDFEFLVLFEIPLTYEWGSGFKYVAYLGPQNALIHSFFVEFIRVLLTLLIR